MLALRSLLFNVAFYALLIVMMIVGLPLLVSRDRTLAYARLWARLSVWLLEVVAGTRLEVRGTPPRGGCFVAAKHQSFLETFALLALLEKPTYVLKRELIWVPLFGWYLKAAGMLPIDRVAGARGFPRLNARVAEAIATGSQLIIFPEGTRRPPGAPPAYKMGAAHLYTAVGAPLVPVALNTGVFWPRRRFLRRPGTAVIAFLEPIAPGLKRDAIMAAMKGRIEAESDALLSAANAELAHAD